MISSALLLRQAHADLTGDEGELRYKSSKFMAESVSAHPSRKKQG